MGFPVGYALEVSDESNGPAYRRELEGFVAALVHSVEQEMRGQRAPMVYEVLSLRLSRRLPGVVMDDEALRDAAARIAVGVPVV